MKMKTIVALMALAAAGAANAALTTGDKATGSSLFLEAWDTTSGVGMVQDLGQTFQTGLAMGQSGSLSVNLNSAAFASLLGTDTAGTNLNWHVYGTLETDQAYSGFGLLTTVSKLPGAAFGPDNTGVATLLGTQTGVGTGHLVDINAALGAATVGNIASTNVAYGANNGGNYYGWFLGGDSAKKGFGALDFYSFTNDPNTFALVTSKLTGAAGGDGKFTLASNGTLTFNAPQAPAAVPVPAAAWLFGSGLLGLVGIGRRRAK